MRRDDGFGVRPHGSGTRVAPVDGRAQLDVDSADEVEVAQNEDQGLRDTPAGPAMDASK